MNSLPFMRVAAFAVAVALELGLVATGAQAAQNKAFIDLTGGPPPVQGEVSMSKAGWIEISSFSWGTSQGMTAGTSVKGVGAGKVTMSALNVVVNNPADQQKLLQAADAGKHIPVLELADYKVTPKGLVPIYNVRFNDVIVTSTDWTGQNDKPSEKISLAYAKVEMSYNTKAANTMDPSVPAGWNRVENLRDLNGSITP